VFRRVSKFKTSPETIRAQRRSPFSQRLTKILFIIIYKQSERIEMPSLTTARVREYCQNINKMMSRQNRNIIILSWSVCVVKPDSSSLLKQLHSCCVQKSDPYTATLYHIVWLHTRYLHRWWNGYNQISNVDLSLISVIVGRYIEFPVNIYCYPDRRKNKI